MATEGENAGQDQKVSKRDLRTGEELLGAGWRPVVPGSEVLIAPGQESADQGKRREHRKVIHIKGIAP